MSQNTFQTLIRLPGDRRDALIAALRDYLAAPPVTNARPEATDAHALTIGSADVSGDWGRWTDPLTGARELHVSPAVPEVVFAPRCKREARATAAVTDGPPRVEADAATPGESWIAVVDRYGFGVDFELARLCSVAFPDAPVVAVELIGNSYSGVLITYRGGRATDGWMSPSPAELADVLRQDADASAMWPTTRWAGWLAMLKRTHVMPETTGDCTRAAMRTPSGRDTRTNLEGRCGATREQNDPREPREVREFREAQQLERSANGAPRIPSYNDTESEVFCRLTNLGVPDALAGVRPVIPEDIASRPDEESSVFPVAPDFAHSELESVAESASGRMRAVGEARLADEFPGGEVPTQTWTCLRRDLGGLKTDKLTCRDPRGGWQLEIDRMNVEVVDEASHLRPSLDLPGQDPRAFTRRKRPAGQRVDPRLHVDRDGVSFGPDGSALPLPGGTDPAHAGKAEMLALLQPSRRRRFLEDRYIHGQIRDDDTQALRRLLDLEEHLGRQVFRALAWSVDEPSALPIKNIPLRDHEDWLPELAIQYRASGLARLERRLAEMRGRRLAGFWDLYQADRPKLTARGFERRAIKWVLATYPHITINASKVEFGFAWSRGDGHELHSYLDNLYRRYLITDSNEITWDDLLSDHFDPTFTIHTGSENLASNPLDADPTRDPRDMLGVRLFPLSWADDEFGRVAHRTLIPGVIVSLGLSSGYGAFRFLAREDLDLLGLNEERAFEIALTNLENTSPGPAPTADELLGIVRQAEEDPDLPDYRTPRQKLRDAFVLIEDPHTGGAYARARFRDGNAACRILLSDFPSVARELLGEDVAVGVPNRDELILIPARPDDLRERLRRDVAYLAEVGPYAITGELLSVTELGIEPWTAPQGVTADEIPSE